MGQKYSLRQWRDFNEMEKLGRDFEASEWKRYQTASLNTGTAARAELVGFREQTFRLGFEWSVYVLVEVRLCWIKCGRG